MTQAEIKQNFIRAAVPTIFGAVLIHSQLYDNAMHPDYPSGIDYVRARSIAIDQAEKLYEETERFCTHP